MSLLTFALPILLPIPKAWQGSLVSSPWPLAWRGFPRLYVGESLVCFSIPCLFYLPRELCREILPLQRNSDDNTKVLGKMWQLGCAHAWHAWGNARDKLKALSPKPMAVLHLKALRGVFSPFWVPLKRVLKCPEHPCSTLPSPSLPAPVRPMRFREEPPPDPSPLAGSMPSPAGSSTLAGAGRRKDTTLQYHTKRTFILWL